MVPFVLTLDYFINNNWNVFGKFGGAYVMQESNFSEDVGYKDSKLKKVKPWLNVGGGYEFDFGLYMNLSYGHLFGTTSTNDAGALTDGETKFKIRSVNSVMFTVGYTLPI